ncbi:hypothetical protein MPER_16320, partial [Moniliophthora perniciosa FA553]
LSPSVVGSVPPPQHPVTGEQRSARDILAALTRRFGVSDFAQAALLKEELWSKLPKPGKIIDFVSEWRDALNMLASVSFQLSWAETINCFVNRLPNDAEWHLVRTEAYTATSADSYNLDRESWDYFADKVVHMDPNRQIRNKMP